jgi:hypothetical protein
MAWLLHHIAMTTEGVPSSLAAAVLIGGSPLAASLPADDPDVIAIVETAVRISGDPEALQRNMEAGLARLVELGCDPSSLAPATRALLACLLSPQTLPADVTISPSSAGAIAEAANDLRLMLSSLRLQGYWTLTDFGPLALLFCALVRLPAGVLRVLAGNELSSLYPAATSALHVLRELDGAVRGFLDERMHPEARPKVLHDRASLADAIVGVLCETARRTVARLGV